jgi:phospholipid/cholesterol/gamma-HCH transport system permease protein
MAGNIHFFQSDPEILLLKLSGSWILQETLPSPSEIEERIASDPQIKRFAFECSELERWDTGLMVFLKKLAVLGNEKSILIEEDGLPDGAKKLLKLATTIPAKEDSGDPMDHSLLYRVGDVSLQLTKAGTEILSFIGEVTLGLGRWIRGKAQFRGSDLKLHLQEAGAQALPIVTLINFLVGVILAFVGAIQLEQFGASIFVADLVGIAMVREMGPMMTAIILAGRSGAAYAAQIGTMMVNEEVDALQTSGFNTIDFLVWPRLLALTIMTPLLALYGDFMGIMGGALVSRGVLDLSFRLYMTQTIAVLNPTHFILGLIKACIYGALVAFAGCMSGMQCGRSASAVGAATTKAVVRAILLIIIASAITTMIYSVLGY